MADFIPLSSGGMWTTSYNNITATNDFFVLTTSGSSSGGPVTTHWANTEPEPEPEPTELDWLREQVSEICELARAA